MMNDYYEILGIEYTASKEEIKAAYRKKIREYHPDTHPDDEYALEMTQLINEAYNTLRDPVKRAEYDDFLKLYAQQQAGTYDFEKATVEPENPHYHCESCGKQDDTLRVTVFLYVISILILTFKKPSVKILCSRCRIKYSLIANILTFILGWWGFPFGIIYTLEALFKNLFGGVKPAENNHILLNILSYDFYDQGRYYEAYETLKASLKMKYDQKVEEFAEFVRTSVSLATPKYSFWKKIGRMNPAFASGPVTLLCFVIAFYLLFNYETSKHDEVEYRADDTMASLIDDTREYTPVVQQYLEVITDSLISVFEHPDFHRIRTFYLDNMSFFYEADSACTEILAILNQVATLVDSKEDIDYLNNIRGYYRSLRKEIHYETRLAYLLKSNRSKDSLDPDKYDLFDSLLDSIDISRIDVDFYSSKINR